MAPQRAMGLHGVVACFANRKADEFNSHMVHFPLAFVTDWQESILVSGVELLIEWVRGASRVLV